MKLTKNTTNVLSILLIVWNIVDIILHVVVGIVEPLRVTGNTLGIAVGIIVLVNIAKRYFQPLLITSALLVLILNGIHSYLYGYGIPMLAFIGVTVFLQLRMAQITKENPSEKALQYKWWFVLIVSTLGAGIVALVGYPNWTNSEHANDPMTMLTPEYTNEVPIWPTKK